MNSPRSDANPLRGLQVMSILAVATSGALAGDLAVTSVDITQGAQFGTTTLVGSRPTTVRVKVAVTGQTSAQGNVDAVLRVYSGGVQLVGSPFFSRNGPITAPITPNVVNVNDTLNFTFIPPVSTDVDFEVVLDPLNRVAETNESNNLFVLSNKAFACRKVLDVAYVSVNYTPGGGQPVAATIEPGTGDAFMRGIYAVGELNYHRSPMGPLTWSSAINSSDAQLLSTLQTLRVTTIPAAGFQRPEFIYGWLPGNPFSGNGEANGIPGDAAFGNTESTRFQRTFAHEIGHCWGRSHTSNTIGSVGFDVEHHLAAPLNLAQTHATTQNDVMVAGLLTNQAWVDSGTYLDCLTDTRSQCTAASSDGSGGEEWPTDAGRMIQVSGRYDHAGQFVEVLGCNLIDIASPTADDPQGDLLLQSYDARGELMNSIRWKSGTARESCAACTRGAPLMHSSSVVSIMIPATVGGQSPARVVMRDLASGKLLASLRASKSAPVVRSLGSRQVDSATVASHTPGAPAVEVFLESADADGDPVRTDIHYSRDGGQSWSPIAVNQSGNSFRVSLADIPAQVPGQGIVKVRVSDGLRFGEREMPAALGVFGADEGSIAGGDDWSNLLGNNPPDIHLLSPNANQSYPHRASVLLHASGWDMEEQYMADAAFAWSSSIDGPIGTGRAILANALSVGSHTITLTGTDAGGLFVTRTVAITVTARNTISIDINNDGIVNGLDLAMLLSNWGGTGVGDLNFSGVVDGADLTSLFAGWTP